MQAPGGPDEDREGGFRHGGWLVPYFNEQFLAIMTEWTKRAGAFLLGRKTYEMFASSWPKSIDPADENAMALNTRPKFVASRTLDRVAHRSQRLRDAFGVRWRPDYADTEVAGLCRSLTPAKLWRQSAR